MTELAIDACDPILSFLAEPALVVFGLSAALGYVYVVYEFMRKR